MKEGYDICGLRVGYRGYKLGKYITFYIGTQQCDGQSYKQHSLILILKVKSHIVAVLGCL